MSQPKVTLEQEKTDLEILESLMARVRRLPGEFRTVGAMAGAAGVDLAHQERMFRAHAHREPKSFLEEARVEGACRMLLNHLGPAANAAETAGFASLATFQAQFHRLTGMTPGRYQALGREGTAFTVDLPAGYRLEDALAYHGRDPLSLTEKVEGRTLLKAMRVLEADVVLELAPEVRRELAARSQMRLFGEGDAAAADAPKDENPRSPVARQILALLRVETPTQIDDLLERAEDVSSSEAIAALFELEMLGAVRQLPGKNFVKVW